MNQTLRVRRNDVHVLSFTSAAFGLFHANRYFCFRASAETRTRDAYGGGICGIGGISGGGENLDSTGADALFTAAHFDDEFRRRRTRRACDTFAFPLCGAATRSEFSRELTQLHNRGGEF